MAEPTPTTALTNVGWRQSPTAPDHYTPAIPPGENRPGQHQTPVRERNDLVPVESSGGGDFHSSSRARARAPEQRLRRAAENPGKGVPMAAVVTRDRDQLLTDPRIAAAGGSARRNDGAGGYNYPGMATAAHWAATGVHRATHFYGCAFCGKKFKGPHAVYTHIAKRHPKRTTVTGETLRAVTGRDAIHGPEESPTDVISVPPPREAA